MKKDINRQNSQAIIFNGRELANQKLKKVKKKVLQLKKQGVSPKLLVLLIGNNLASQLYVSLKKKKAQAVGIDLEVKKLGPRVSSTQVIKLIHQANRDPTIQGILVQLPLPGKLKEETDQIIKEIALKKDVDGLRKDSPFVSATATAVLETLDLARKLTKKKQLRKIAVVGSKGMVGQAVLKQLKIRGEKRKSQLIGCDLETKDLPSKLKDVEVIISATGQPGLIKKEMVKDGAIVIDLGSPQGDVDFKEVKKKASFITPVPGGIGPVTISCLLYNLAHGLIL